MLMFCSTLVPRLSWTAVDGAKDNTISPTSMCPSACVFLGAISKYQTYFKEIYIFDDATSFHKSEVKSSKFCDHRGSETITPQPSCSQRIHLSTNQTTSAFMATCTSTHSLLI
ncbi:hypothetical protein DFH06DRAFT_6345 [Mycena polygramma]|nr:hypothetical protein DFH06DRAFT_6345 [Mycena polygramma]